MKYEYTHRQYLQLESLAYNLFVLRFREEDEYNKKILRDTIKFTFDVLDNLNVPYWVQNEIIFYVEQKLKYKYTIKEHLESMGITPKDKHEYYK